MKLKPLKWCVTGQFANANTDIFFQLEVGVCLNSKLYRWVIRVDDCGEIASGLSATLEQGMLEAEAAYLKLLLDELEPDDEPIRQRDDENSGPNIGGDGCGGCCPDCHHWLLECECGPGCQPFH